MVNQYFSNNFFYLTCLIAILVFCFLAFGVDAHAYTEVRDVIIGTPLTNYYPGATLTDTDSPFRFATQGWTTSATGTNLTDLYIDIRADHDADCSYEDTQYIQAWVCAGSPDWTGENVNTYQDDHYNNLEDYTPCYNYAQPLIATTVPISILPTTGDLVKLWDDAMIDLTASSTYYLNILWPEDSYYPSTCVTMRYNTTAPTYGSYSDLLGETNSFYMSIWKATDWAGSGSTATSTTLEWISPKNDYILNNSEWNDWNVVYDLTQADSDSADWLLMEIDWTDSSFRQVIDIDDVTNTVNPTSVAIERSDDPQDGNVFATARLYAMASTTDCQPDKTLLPGDCTWDDMELLVTSETIEFISSSTSQFDIGSWQPVDGPQFIPASSTNTTTDWHTNLWNVISSRMFPFSIINQLQDAIEQAVARKGGNPTVSLDTFVADEYETYSNNATLFSGSIISSYFPEWLTIRNGLGTLVYLVNLFVLMGIVYRLRKFI